MSDDVQETAAAAEAELDLSAMLLPLSGGMLVVPSVSVAEIIRSRETEPAAASSPEWLLGYMKWRQYPLPVISFEAINGDALPTSNTGSRLVILNSLVEGEERPMLAVVTQGVPNLLRLTPEVITAVDGEPGQAELQRVRVHGQSAAIPDIDFLAAQVAQHAAESSPAA